MITKTVIAACLLLVSYSLILRHYKSDKLGTSQHQWQDNMVRAQKFLYDQDSVKSVIVGSSLSLRLISDTLPGVVNLAFAGQSIIDGLRIVSRKERYPRKIFIEMNYVFRPPNQTFLSSLTSPIHYYSKMEILALREENQPVGLIGKGVRPYVKYALNGIKRNTVTTKPGAENNDGFEKILQLKAKEYDKIPSEKEISERFNELKQLVDYFQSRGVYVTFFSMPVNCRLAELSRAKFVRQEFYHWMDKSRYHYMAEDNCAGYKTVDGEHLDVNEARRFTAYFRKHIE